MATVRQLPIRPRLATNDTAARCGLLRQYLREYARVNNGRPCGVPAHEQLPGWTPVGLAHIAFERKAGAARLEQERGGAA